MDEPLRLAVFDCDGTLVDSQHSILSVAFYVFDDCGIPRPSEDAMRRLVGSPLEQFMESLVPDGGDDLRHRLVKLFQKEALRRHHSGDFHDPLYCGAKKCLKAVSKAGWLMGVATNKSMPGLLSTLNRHRIRDQFVTLQTADQGPSKPSPEMMFRAIAETGVDIKNSIVIGDTTFDMQMARAAGAGAIGVGWGYHEKKELKSAGAELIVDRFMDIPPALETLLERK